MSLVICVVLCGVCVCAVNLLNVLNLFSMCRCHSSKSSLISGERDHTHGYAECASQTHPCQISSDTCLNLFVPVVSIVGHLVI